MRLFHIIIGMLVPNNRDRQGKRLWLPNSLENNFTITYPSNTGHKSLSTYRANSIMNLFNSLIKVWNSLNWSCWIAKIFILLMHSLTHLLSLAPSLIHSLTHSLTHSLARSLTHWLTHCLSTRGGTTIYSVLRSSVLTC